MNEFKKGDLVRCVDSQGHLYIAVGKVYRIVKVSLENFLVVNNKGQEVYYRKRCFTKAYPNEPHVHADKIKAWADGAWIKETLSEGVFRIFDDHNFEPVWSPDYKYEIIDPEPTELENLRAEVDRLSERLKELEDG